MHEPISPVSRKGEGLRRALFLCRDNRRYGRFCEELFNSLIRDEGLNWQAVSRAWSSDAIERSAEPMAPDAIAALRALGAAPVNHGRLPLAATAFDFDTSDVIIAITPGSEPAGRSTDSADPGFALPTEFWSVDPGTDTTRGFERLAASVRGLLDRICGRAGVQTVVLRARHGYSEPSAKLATQPLPGSRRGYARSQHSRNTDERTTPDSR